MSQSTDSKNDAKVSDLIAERQANLTRSVAVRNLHKQTWIDCIPPNGGLGKVTPMKAYQKRHWLRPVTVEEPKAKTRKEAPEKQ